MSEEDAWGKLQEKLDAYQADAQQELDFRTRFYDDKTKHGAEQHVGPEFGLPGGDAVFTCPADAGNR